MSVCVQPLDVVRTRIQADATRADVLSMAGTVRTIYAEGGVRCARRRWQHSCYVGTQRMLEHASCDSDVQPPQLGVVTATLSTDCCMGLPPACVLFVGPS